MWYNKCVDLLTVSVTARESAGEPYTLVEIAGEADVTNTDELRRLLDEHQSGRGDHSTPLWTLLMFESFLRNVMGARATDEAPAAALR